MITVFIIHCGEESFNQCFSSIQNQKLAYNTSIKIEIIKDVYPMSEAFNEMHRQCQTPYFVQVDTDMILNEDAIQILYDEIIKTPFWIYAVYGQLYEEGFGIGGTVRCWKKNFFKYFQFRDVRTVDRDLFKRARWLGLRRRKVPGLLGTHLARHSYLSEYLKTKSDIEKWRFLGRKASRYALPLFENLRKNPVENRFKILGALSGVLSPSAQVKNSKNIFFEKEKLSSLLSTLGYEHLQELKIDAGRIKHERIQKFFVLNYDSWSSKTQDELFQQVVTLFSNKKMTEGQI